MIQQNNVSLIPYSSLATRTEWRYGSKRSNIDTYSKRKYDSSKDNNLEIVNRVSEFAKKYDVSMTCIVLAWQWKKGVASPIVGVTKISYFDDPLKALDLELSDDDVSYFEETYKPHEIVGSYLKMGLIYKINFKITHFKYGINKYSILFCFLCSLINKKYINI